MSEGPFRCSNCRHKHFSTLLEAVRHVVSERDSRKRVQCCVCSKAVRNLRPHIRKSHKKLCPVSCSACQAYFVEQRDLDNHQRNGCPRQKHESHQVTSPGLIGTFLEQVGFRNRSDVNKFITNELTARRKAASEVVRELRDHLEQPDNLPPEFSIDEVVKGGSTGKGTAVRGKADIDCVVFLNNVKSMKEHKLKLEKTKKQLESCLLKNREITCDGQTPFAVKCKFRGYDIDLLPTFTTGQSQVQLFKEMIGCAKKDQDYYSVHCVISQVKFVKGQPPNVKDLIRLVKYWRKTCIEDKSTGNTRLPSSYPLELITIACWEKAGKPASFDIRAGFKSVLQQLVDNSSIHVIWDTYYNAAVANKGMKRMKERNKSPPFVLDPANPTNNVCSAWDAKGAAKGWEIVADVADMTLQRQPLKDINFNKRNWKME